MYGGKKCGRGKPLNNFYSHCLVSHTGERLATTRHLFSTNHVIHIFPQYKLFTEIAVLFCNQEIIWEKVKDSLKLKYRCYPYKCFLFESIRDIFLIFFCPESDDLIPLNTPDFCFIILLLCTDRNTLKHFRENIIKNILPQNFRGLKDFWR